MDPALGQMQHGVETGLAPDLLVAMHETMLRARLLEERLIRMVKQGDGYFWIGGPGEEAFNVPLGMLVHKGEGPPTTTSTSTTARAARCWPWAPTRSTPSGR
jgi:TPP-dependent pyruvate/acetoin dehydrogenase alpha subunit